MNKEKELKLQGYTPLPDRVVKFDRSLYDYKSGCCGGEIHAEISDNKDIGFACKKCGLALSGAGVFKKKKNA